MMAVDEPNLIKKKYLISYFDYEKPEFLLYQVLGFTEISVLPHGPAEPTHCVVTWVSDPTHRSAQLRGRKDEREEGAGLPLLVAAPSSTDSAAT